MSTFARTDPEVTGHGLGADAALVSTLVGVYVVYLTVWAICSVSAVIAALVLLMMPRLDETAPETPVDVGPVV